MESRPIQVGTASAETPGRPAEPLPGGNGRHEDLSGYETAVLMGGILGLGEIAVEPEFDFDFESGPLPLSGVIYERAAEPVSERTQGQLPKGWHKAIQKEREREWNKNKRTQRQQNIHMLHGGRAGANNNYYDHGVARPGKKKQEKAAAKRTNGY